MDSIKAIILNQIAKEIEVQQLLKKYFPTPEEFLDNHLHRYGDDFVLRLERLGLTEKGRKLIFKNWTREYAGVIGDLRIHHAITAGCAQIGKSLFNMELLVDFLVITGLNALWFYPTKQQVDALVPEVFSKIVQFYVENLEKEILVNTGKVVKLIKPTDRQLASRFQVNNATAIFSYASTSGKSDTPSNTGLATVGASASSISAGILFVDERSQIPPEAIAILPRRLDASPVPTQPIREVGTFGSGLGIEIAVDASKHHFYPHTACSHCKHEIPLSPKGCLLKPDEKGRYLTETGRPKDWFYHDENNKVESAYFGCSSCGGELSTEDRIENSFFKCLRTGAKLKDYREQLPTDLVSILKKRESVTIHLSPLLRDTLFNLAENLIKTGLETESTRDYQQQVLGFSSESDNSRVTIKHLQWAQRINRETPLPEFKAKDCLVLAGIDQGRQEDYLTIVAYLLNQNKSLSVVQRLEQSYRKILVCKSINRRETESIFKTYNVKAAFIDNEPDRQGAFDLSQKLPITPIDQRPKIPQLIKEIEVSTGGIEIQALAIDNSYFQDMALNGFVGGYVQTPKWNLSDRGVYSPPRHFMSVQRNSEEKWERAKDHIDDLWFSYMMCEACFYQEAKKILDEEARRNKTDWYKYL